MIIKRTRGVDAAKALAYDYGPGKGMEHHNPRRVAGTVAGRDWRGRARTMQAQLRDGGDTVRAQQRQARPVADGQKRTRGQAGGRGRVLRLAVAAAPEDRVMSDREWGSIARRVIDEFTQGKADGYAWEAVRHDPRHIHITLLQRGHDGRLLSESHDYQRFGRISRGLERDYELRQVDHTRTDTPERKRARSAYRKQAKANHRVKVDRSHELRRTGQGHPSQAMDAPSRADRMVAAREEAARREQQRQQRRARDAQERGGRER